MAKKTQIIIEIDAKGTPVLKKQTKAIKDQTKALKKQDQTNKKTTKSQRQYHQRQEKGVIGVANQTKSFSKMQQTMDGGGGAGGLVRAYALLAANVFALSMAFGVLSRAAQVDTLTDSMKRLEEVGGQSVRAIAKGLQEASGSGLDFAEAMRSTSLALSAGFDSTAITELGEVARNAAVSLGRPMGDALDRIFRGVIKVEPELLDEIGLFVRVREAAAKYASTLGLAASELTEMQRRQAFANEAISQGQEKFAAFGDIETDQFSQLAASFSDIAQSALSLINWGIKPLIDLLIGSKELMMGLFVGIAGFLLSKAIPAMGLFTQTINQQANDAVKRHNEYLDGLKSSSEASKTAKLDHLKGEEQLKKVELDKMKRAKKMSKDYKGQRTQSAELKKVNKEYAKAKTHEQKIIALQNKRKVLNKSIRTGTREAITEAKAGLQDEINKRKQILTLRQQSAAVGRQEFVGPMAGKPAANEAQRLAATAAQTTAMATIAGTASTQGFGKALGSLSGAFDDFQYDMGKAGKNVGSFGKGMFYLKGAGKAATVSMQGLMATMMPWITALMIAIPLLTWILKKFGMWDKAHKAYQDAQEKTNLLMDNFTEKLDYQIAAQHESADGHKKFREANTAMNITLEATTGAILAEMEAWEKFKKEATATAIWFENFKKKWFGDDLVDSARTVVSEALQNKPKLEIKTQQILEEDPRLDQVRIASRGAVAREAGYKSELAFIAEIRKLNSGKSKHQGEEIEYLGIKLKKGEKFARMRQAMNDRETFINKQLKIDEIELNKLKKLGFMTDVQANEMMKKLNKQTGLFARGGKNLDSVMEGAKETVRTYKDLFITKTDVDKPMSTFAQLTASVYDTVKDMEISYSKRKAVLAEINDKENTINQLMSTTNRIRYANAKNDKERMKILEEQEQSYRAQQTILVKNKAEIALITMFSKQISKLTKEAGEFMAVKLQMDGKVLEMKIQEKKITTDNHLNSIDITRETMKTAEWAKKTVGWMWLYDSIVKRLGGKEYAEALRHLAEESAMSLEFRVFEATKESKMAKAILDVEKKRVQANQKLNAEKLKGIKLDKQIESFSKRGTTKLSALEEVKFLIEAEKKRLEFAKERADVEKAIARVQMAILIATMNVMKTEIEAYNKKIELLNSTETNVDNLKIINIEQLETDLRGAAQVLVDTIDEGLENSTKKYAVSLMKKLEDIKTKNSSDVINFADSTAFKNLDQIRTTRAIGEEATTKAGEQQDIIDNLEIEIAKTIEGSEAWENLKDKIEAATKARDAFNKTADEAVIAQFTNAIRNFGQAVAQLGEEGMLAATMADFTANMIENFEKIDEGTLKTADKLAMVANVIQGIASIMSASSAAKVAAIDKEIAAEQKRDGKSKGSLAKIKAMEAKKEKMKKRLLNKIRK